MSGETEQAVSAWTIDSLHSHLLKLLAEKDERIAEQDRRYEQRFESQEKAITTAMTAYGTAVQMAAAKYADEMTTVRSHFDTLLAERDLRYGERFEASQVAISAALAEREKAIQAALLEREKAVAAAFAAQEKAIELALTGLRSFYDTVLTERDDRYDQRYQSSEKAVIVALATVEKEFHEHIAQVRNETTVAMSAADKAISKSETATEKRFESVNEFRAQQADIITTFARKDEVNQRLIGLTDKVESVNAGLSSLGNSTMPRAEYDRAHTDLIERVLQVEKSLGEKLETQVRALESRFAGLQQQLSSIQQITS